MTIPHEIPCKTIKEFWQAISPVGGVYEGYLLPVFRGQRDADWPLTPSVLRPTYLAENTAVRLKDGKDQLRTECLSLSTFARFCNDAGLILPVDPHSLDWGKIMAGKENGEWPPRELYGLMAIAQHHGLPTRLLDWTYNPYVAGYFAASSALKADKPAENIVVWITQQYAFENATGLDLIKVPSAITPNLSAQQGIFSLLKSTPGLEGETDISRLIAGDVWKVLLPVNLAGELLEACRRLNISATTMFPGYDGAAKAVNEAFLINRSN